MNSKEADLQLLCEKAKELRATAAVPIAARDIVVDERARLKCMAPKCPYYGRPLCPPNLMPIAEFRQVIAAYENALLAQWEISWTQARIQKQFGDVTLAELYPRADFQETIIGEFREFYSALGRLEAEAFRLGYRFAAALGSGNYEMLYPPKAQGAEPPAFQARPAMEGMGIDVFETAHKAGLSLDIPSGDAPAKFTGLLLVD